MQLFVPMFPHHKDIINVAPPNRCFLYWSKNFSFWKNRKKTSVSDSANFYALEWLEKKFSPAQNCPKQRKNLYLIKFVPKWKRAIRKGYTSFIPFNFWDLSLVQFDLALNSASGNLNCFFKEFSRWYRKKQSI